MSLWGTQNSSTQVFKGVRHVVCENAIHGVTSGVVITESVLKNNPIFAKLRTYKQIDTHYWRGHYYFADVNMANMLEILLPDDALKIINPTMMVEDIRNNARRLLLDTNSDFYMHVTGEDLSIFESRSMLRKLTHSNPEHYFIHRPISQSGLPDGMILVLAKNGKKQSHLFLAAIEDYKRMIKNPEIPVQIEQYEEYKQAV